MLQLKSNAILWGALLLVGCYVPIVLAQDADITCYECDSVSDPNCITDVTKITAKSCQTSCFTKIETTGTIGKVSRGCAAANEVCEAPNCYSCPQSNCNTNTVCKTCDSTAECAQTDVADAKYNQVCPTAETKCFVNVNKEKKIVRRCATAEDLKDCPADTCNTCNTPNCNAGIFPANRRLCYQCQNCENVINNAATPVLPCLLYEPNDQCYVTGDTDTTMMRGCSSDAQDKCKNPDLCVTCAADGCNDSGFTRAQKMQCIQCSGASDSDCMWGQPVSNAKDCAKQIPYNAKEKCYTQVKDNAIQRGCYYDRTEAEGWCTAESCTTCDTASGCNNLDKMDFTCIRCRSDEDTKCENNAKNITGSACRNPVTKDTQNCFQGIWNGVTIRGCLVDVDSRMKSTCEDKNNKQCSACLGKDCNTVKTGGAASVVVTTSVVVLAAILLLVVS